MKPIYFLIVLMWMSFQSLGQFISDSVDVVSYTIFLEEINQEQESISGHTIVTLTAADEPLSAAVLQLMDLEVDSVLVNDTQVSFTYQDNLITIPFDEAISNTEQKVLDIYYHGQPFSEGWGGFQFSGDYAYNLGVGFESIPHNLGKTWFPCIDDFHDRANYTYYITVDADEDAVCGGTLQEIIEEDNGQLTYHWVMEHSIPTYLASVAVGDYVLYEDTFNGMAADVPIQIWVRPSEIDNVEGSFVHLKDILDVYEQHWGAYPFSRVGVVSTSQGAMEHATNIAYPYGTINGGLSYEWLYAHELAHMWFGDKVTCASAEEMWMNEGWAVFNEFLYREGIYGEEVWREEYFDLHHEVLQYAHTSSGDGEYYALDSVPQEVTYGTTSYDKGALVVHTLRNYLGDEVFFPAMQAFLEAFAYDFASSEDLRDFLSDETGIDMNPFFDSWVMTPGFPHFEIDSVVENGVGYEVYVQQKSKGREELFDNNKVEVFFMDENWDLWSDVMMVSGEQSSQVFEVPFVPAMVMLDFEDNMADATTDMSFVIEETGTFSSAEVFAYPDVTSIMDSAFLRITHHWVAPDTNRIPVENLRLSDYRYWQVDGVDLDNMTASCRFYYNKNAFLDNTLLTNDDDVITLLYRPDQYADWQETEHIQIGPATIGYLEVEQLQKGEYTLAVWENGASAVLEMDQENEISLFPNPANEKVFIEIPSGGTLRIFAANGSMVFTKEFSSGPSQFSLNVNDFIAGNYFVKWIPVDGEIKTTRLIIAK